TLVQVSPSRVLLVDLGAGLGAAAGAAAGSPLIFDTLTTGKTRGFLAATAAGTLLGGSVAWWLTREHTDAPRPRSPSADRPVVPLGGVVGASETRDGATPAYGVGVRGIW